MKEGFESGHSHFDSSLSPSKKESGGSL